MTTLLERLHRLWELSAEERNARIRLALGYRLHVATAKAVYSTIGSFLNRANWRYMLEFRPDFHRDFNGVPEYDKLLNIWLAGNHYPNGGDLARFYAIYLNLQQVFNENVPGEIVELGVYKGNSAGILGALARQNQRRLFLFDTFEGFDQRDLHKDDKGRSVQFTDTSLASVMRLVGAENVTYIAGFFPDSMSQIVMPEAIAFAHIDCDLYEPMRAGLEAFYPRLVPGGALMLHDYSSGHWPGAKRAIDEFFANRPESPVLMCDKSGTAIIRRAK